MVSEKNIPDIIAGVILAIYIMPEIRGAFLSIFCGPEFREINPWSCGIGFFTLYILPAIPIIWFIFRIVSKLRE